MLAIFISGAFLANSEAAGRMTEAIAKRLVGERGPEFAKVAEQTVRSVASGILGVALIQALLAGLGFLVAGVPAAGLLDSGLPSFRCRSSWGGDRLIPVVIYLILDGGHGTAVGFLIWAIWSRRWTISKPTPSWPRRRRPMLIIFVGAIGGFLSAGIIGLFIGAVVLPSATSCFLPGWRRIRRLTSCRTRREHAECLKLWVGAQKNPALCSGASGGSHPRW